MPLLSLYHERCSAGRCRSSRSCQGRAAENPPESARSNVSGGGRVVGRARGRLRIGELVRCRCRLAPQSACHQGRASVGFTPNIAQHGMEWLPLHIGRSDAKTGCAARSKPQGRTPTTRSPPPQFAAESAGTARRTRQTKLELLIDRPYVTHGRLHSRSPPFAAASQISFDQARSKRSRFITLSHAATKSRTNFSPASSLP